MAALHQPELTPAGADRILPFDELPASARLRAFGVDYAHLKPPEGGDLYLTRHGWDVHPCLLPSRWYTDRQYDTEGERLVGSTGRAYRVHTRPAGGRRVDIVVKFSRVAQDACVTMSSTFPADVAPEVIAGARFNSPMEEFGLLMDLRSGRFDPAAPRVLAQRPLAIYAPPETYQLWQLGRDDWRFEEHDRLLARDQEGSQKAIELDIKRQYVVLFGWIKGLDGEDAFKAGLIDEQEFLGLAPRANEELQRLGFVVLDHKPKHCILRARPDGSLLRRDGELVYGLVDFELLQRTAEHRERFRAVQRRRYVTSPVRADERDEQAPEFPSHLRATRVFGVPYVFGRLPDGGMLWIVGREPELFDYFLPDRWRRTPHVKLSPMNEVYRTRTRDGIDVVYRRSRVGARPRVDPLLETCQRIRQHGINSPFEEIAVARMLRDMGISTTEPRAILRTGHETTRAMFLRDDRRFGNHAELLTPDGAAEPVLSPQHDYYTLWDCFRGDLAADADAGRPMSLDMARDDGLIDGPQHASILADTRGRFERIGIGGPLLQDWEICVAAAPGGGLLREDDGSPRVRLHADALTLYEFGLLDDAGYRKLIAYVDARLRSVDCEALNLGGNHLILSIDPDGRFDRDASGPPHATLSNFELVRGLYRPLR